MFHGYVRGHRSATLARAAFTVLAGATVAGLASPQVAARAAVGPQAIRAAVAFDDQHNGNGKFNRSSSPFNSPNINRGVQQITTANSGGNNIIQAGSCRRRHHCRMSQRAYMGGW